MRLLFVLVFILLTIADAFVAVQFGKKRLHVYLKSTILSYGLFCLFLIASYFFHIAIPYYILILVMVTLFTHSFLGHYLEFYRRFIAFDRCLHAFGTFSSALFLYTLLMNLTQAGGSKFFQAVVVAALGIAAGAVFELFEYTADKKRHTKAQKGLMDTDTDTLSNTIGGLCAAIFACFTFL